MTVEDPGNRSTERIDEAVLALLYLTSFRDDGPDATRAWKGHDWDALRRLHEAGLISDPKGKAKSVVFTEEGWERCRAAFEKLFANAE